MKGFSRLIHFESAGGKTYFADLGLDSSELPAEGSSVPAYKSFDDLTNGRQQVNTTINKVPIITSFVAETSLLNKIHNHSSFHHSHGMTSHSIAWGLITGVMQKKPR